MPTDLRKIARAILAKEEHMNPEEIEKGLGFPPEVLKGILAKMGFPDYIEEDLIKTVVLANKTQLSGVTMQYFHHMFNTEVEEDGSLTVKIRQGGKGMHLRLVPTAGRSYADLETKDKYLLIAKALVGGLADHWRSGGKADFSRFVENLEQREDKLPPNLQEDKKEKEDSKE